MLLLIPRIGAVAAVARETPFILAASWWICGRCMAQLHVGSGTRGRIMMGASALFVLQGAEVPLSLALGHSLGQYVAAYRVPDGAIGLVGQLCFAAFALLRRSSV